MPPGRHLRERLQRRRQHRHRRHHDEWRHHANRGQHQHTVDGHQRREDADHRLAQPADIRVGTALSGAQLNAQAEDPDTSAAILGTYVYTPDVGAVLGTGPQTLTVTFTPLDTVDYVGTSTSTTINVLPQLMPNIVWSQPADIRVGTALSSAQLDAQAYDPNGDFAIGGSYTYSPDVGAVLGLGTQTLTVTFTPYDTTDYVGASTTTTINVIPKLVPNLVWNQPADIYIGTALSSTQLDAQAYDPVGDYTIGGSYTYSPDVGTVLGLGAGQTLSVTFTPYDTTDYVSASTTTTINVIPKLTPNIVWSQPADIRIGTALSSSQLDAQAYDPVGDFAIGGTYVYTPDVGTVLGLGAGQTLNVTFTPFDTVDYSGVTGSTTTPTASPLTQFAHQPQRIVPAAPRRNQHGA